MGFQGGIEQCAVDHAKWVRKRGRQRYPARTQRPIRTWRMSGAAVGPDADANPWQNSGRWSRRELWAIVRARIPTGIRASTEAWALRQAKVRRLVFGHRSGFARVSRKRDHDDLMARCAATAPPVAR